MGYGLRCVDDPPSGGTHKGRWRQGWCKVWGSRLEKGKRMEWLLQANKNNNNFKKLVRNASGD